MKTFEDWFKKVKYTKTAYFAKELKPLLHKCWNDAKPIKKLTRSDAQRKYQWGVVYSIISKEIGYLPDEIHQLMGKQFLKYENNGEMFVKSTTKLNTKDMEVYLENVRRFASMELRCFIPLPNETEFSYEVK